MIAYRKLEARAERVADIDGALACLNWDSRTMMPRGGSGSRADEIATLSLIGHEVVTASEHAALLDAAEAEADCLDAWQLANLRAMRRIQRQATAIDPALVAALARATSKAEMIWRDARARADWSMMQPVMAEVLRLVGEQAMMLGAAFDLEPYDALLDMHEPGLRQAVVDPIFARLIEVLPGMVDRAVARQPTLEPLKGPFPVARQRALGAQLMTRLGFDFDRGRLDESAHPFCGGTPDDVRITTRYDDQSFAPCLMAVLHETGHALYNAGLPPAWRRQPVGAALGMVVHESQSLLIEMQVCRSRAFLAYLAPLIVQTFGAAPRTAFASDNLYHHAVHVERGLIRVDADELTYPLHVILRYRLEQALLSGALPLAELPAAWHRGMIDLLGVAPSDDGQGCLQDVHWAVGSIGYFPCYTLGAVMAAQLYAAARAEDPAIAEGIGRGEFDRLLAWLRRRIHLQGCRYEFQELLRQATGRELELQPYLDHLEARYAG